MYDKSVTDGMRKELVDQGVEDLITSQEVDDFLKEKAKSAVVFINSVCGCSAGTARPAFINSLSSSFKPTKVGTVFAGVDIDSTKQIRKHLEGYPPSSPAIALFREGEVIHVFERNDIEGIDPQTLGQCIEQAYQKFCANEINESIELKKPFDFLEKTVEEVKVAMAKKSIELLDCRSEQEREVANIEGSIFLTQELAGDIIKNWDKNKTIVFFCHYGEHSLQAVQYFKQQGFSNCYSMRGGIDLWTKQIDNQIPNY